MANIAAKDVMELRKKTGIGMMECKKALVEAEGDFDQAMKILREKGLAVAAKKSDRIAAEGVVDILKSDDGLTTAIVEVNSETDFVANNATFREFVKGILAHDSRRQTGERRGAARAAASTAPTAPLTRK